MTGFFKYPFSLRGVHAARTFPRCARTAVARHRPTRRVISFGELVLQRSLLRSRPAKRRLERSKRVSVSSATHSGCRFVRQQAKRCPTTTQNEKRNLGSNRERIFAGHDHHGDRPAVWSRARSRARAGAREEREIHVHDASGSRHGSSRRLSPKCGMKLVPASEKKRSTFNAQRPNPNHESEMSHPSHEMHKSPRMNMR